MPTHTDWDGDGWNGDDDEPDEPCVIMIPPPAKDEDGTEE